MPLGHQAIHHLFPDQTAIGERPLTGRYWVQKWNGAEWRDMSAGEARPSAGAGRELAHMVRQARALEGRCRIIKRGAGGSIEVLWPESEVAAGKPKRDWRLHVDIHGIQTCGECGRSIMPKTDFMRDAVSGHMNRHVECHERVESMR